MSERAPWFDVLADRHPSLDEAVAVFAAVEAYHRKMHPRKRRTVNELPRLVDEMAKSAARVRSVTSAPISHSEPA